jgi:hypothetical protein
LANRLSTCVLSFLLAIGGGPAAPFGLDLQGKPIQQLNLPDTRVVVLFFAASDCPISNRYAPEIVRLRDEFNSRHVAFWWVFPNPEETAQIVQEHQHQFAIDGSTILDAQQTLAQMAHVTTTPESAVFAVTDGRLREIYHGRVDDRYLSIGQERPRPTRHDLEDAISSALDNKPVSPAVTHPVGCSIVPLKAVQ